MSFFSRLLFESFFVSIAFLFIKAITLGKFPKDEAKIKYPELFYNVGILVSVAVLVILFYSIK